MTITIAPVSDILGAEITGVDMTRVLNGDDLAAIKQAFLDHLVLRFRD